MVETEAAIVDSTGPIWPSGKLKLAIRVKFASHSPISTFFIHARNLRRSRPTPPFQAAPCTPRTYSRAAPSSQRGTSCASWRIVRNRQRAGAHLRKARRQDVSASAAQCRSQSDVAHSCLVARRADVLAKVRDECVAQGLNPARIITVPADVTKAPDLVKVRDEVVKGMNQSLQS